MVVMKFGGTSVADRAAIERLMAIVRAERQAEAQREGGDPRGPVVVVSALSGVTDRLLGLAAQAGAGDIAGAQASVHDLQQRHLTVSEVITDEVLGTAVREEIAREFAELERIVSALGVLREVSPRWMDTIAATGEILSSRLVAAALNADGLPATWVDARGVLVTDGEHQAAAPQFPETTAALMAHADPVLAARRIPVIGGFVGATREGTTTTLGRGGSDYSAAIIGACLGASEIQIWTDVDGMLTSDPRIVKDPYLVPHISFAEASELAYFGAKVLHPATIQPAVARNIPVRILNSQRANSLGTLITAERPDHQPAVDGGGCEERRDGGGHHLLAHADGARLPEPPLCRVRPLPDPGGRGHHFRGERIGHRRRPATAARSGRRALGVRRGVVRGPHGDCLRRRRRPAAGSGGRRARIDLGRRCAAADGLAGGGAEEHHLRHPRT